MSIIGLTTPALASSTNTSKSDTSKLSDNYQMFLQLLVTQLKNQSPLNPMNSDQFTSQLVQYSSVEQQIKTNQNLSDLKSALTLSSATTLVNYVGTTVTADGSQTTLGTDGATWSITAPAAAPDAKYVIRDSGGNIVYNGTQSLSKGANSISWTGRKDDGSLAPTGTYSITVSGKDASGATVNISTDLTGVVSNVDFSGTEPLLTIGDSTVSVWNVKSVKSTS